MPDQPENRIDDDLLGKYLAGETDAAESERVRRWLGQDHSERQEFDRFERIWNTAGQLKQPPESCSIPVDTDAAWQKMRSKMHPPTVAGPGPIAPETEPAAPEPVVKPLPVEPFRTTRHRSWWQSPAWAVAAMAVVVSGLLWVLLQQTQTEPVAEVAAVTTSDKIEKILPDGSTVLLNKDSKLIYPERFADDSREVELTGEAFFDVKPDPLKPFRIRVRNTTVQVLGTSFSIRAYTDDVRVAVQTGKVKFSARKQEITLVRNEQAAFDAKKDTIIKAPKFNANAMTFQSGKLEFEAEPLSNVVKTLNEVYHADIHLANEQIGGCLFSSNFKNDSLSYVLNTVRDALHLSIQREGNRIILDGKSPCQ